MPRSLQLYASHFPSGDAAGYRAEHAGFDALYLSGAGVTNLNGGTTISGNDTIDTRTLNNFGTVSTSGAVTLVNGASINNTNGGIWNLLNGSSIGGGTFSMDPDGQSIVPVALYQVKDVEKPVFEEIKP